MKILHGGTLAKRAFLARKEFERRQEDAVKQANTGPCRSRPDLIAEYEKRLQSPKRRRVL